MPKVDKAFLRKIEECHIPKEDLLRILKQECFAPEAATRIISTGHNPDELVIGVTFD